MKKKNEREDGEFGLEKRREVLKLYLYSCSQGITRHQLSEILRNVRKNQRRTANVLDSLATRIQKGSTASCISVPTYAGPVL